MYRFKALAALFAAALLALGSCSKSGEEGGLTVSDDNSAVYETAGSVYTGDTSFPHTDYDHAEDLGDGVYRVAGFSVTLPSGFKTGRLADFPLYASNGEGDSVALAADAFYRLYAAGFDTGVSAADYALEALKKRDGPTVPVVDEGDRAYFEYTAESDGVKYRYFCYAYKGADAFYLLQLCCKDEDSESHRRVFEGIADSAKVS